MFKAGPASVKKRKQPKLHPPNASKTKRLSEKQKVHDLDLAALTFAPTTEVKSFVELPISDGTKRGLKKAFFVDMTDIQRQSLPFSLKGQDVLGAARTGSGKTLAFLIPVLEILYRKRWGPSDGLGALIISPTRELAVQIFEVLRSIGGYHSFSAGLVIGGKNLKDESERLARMNILVATPGRLLQHMDQTVGFDSDNLQILVLDEADRILDLGFQRTLSALLSHLPKTRQTLLFSATQTDSVQSLARLSLREPVHIGLHSDRLTTTETPKNLTQHYLVTSLDQKLSILWSFIKTHLQSKTLVFLSSCKQVRFVFETFCKMHPGIPLLHMHGKQKQSARLTTYTKFTSCSHSVLFATDVAARGLDFPAVDWVVQVDAPEDVETYIHRVGRTARYESKGQALLFLMPSEEEGFKTALEKRGLIVHLIKNRASKTQSIENQLQKLAFQEPEIKYLAQRAFVSYMRSVYLHKDKTVFKLADLPADLFAQSLGLPGTPKIKFLSKELAVKAKNVSRVTETALAKRLKGPLASGSEEEGEESDADADTSDDGDNARSSKVVRTKYDRMFERKNQNILSKHYSKLIDHSASSTGDHEEEDDFVTLKRANHELSDDGESFTETTKSNLSKRKQKLSRSKRAIAELGGLSTKLVFDDEGQPHQLYEMEDGEELFKDGITGAVEVGRKFAEVERVRLKEVDVADKEEAKEKKREKKRKRKEKEKAGEGDPKAMITSPLDGGYVSPEFDLPSESEQSDAHNHTHRTPSKRSKTSHTIKDEEELALKFLRSRGS